ncbi:hypothetical protein [Alishewanella phage vB_AspM_Slickus01]|nr:hypothetical protein [Alishewanella phage vB_AspM_Slickus01]
MNDVQAFWLLYLIFMLFSWAFVFIGSRTHPYVFRENTMGKKVLYISLIPVANIMLALIIAVRLIIELMNILFRFISNDFDNY